jgi:hypothetical protein
MPTNAQLQEAIEALSKRIIAIEERMKTYEEQARENNAILHDIKQVMTVVKWGGLAVAGALVSQAIGYIIHFLH